MSTFADIECDGQPVTIELQDDDTIVFHGWDIEAEMAEIALGFERDPSECLRFVRLIEGRWPLDMHIPDFRPVDSMLTMVLYYVVKEENTKHGDASTIQLLIDLGARIVFVGSDVVYLLFSIKRDILATILNGGVLLPASEMLKAYKRAVDNAAYHEHDIETARLMRAYFKKRFEERDP